jgi:hypothetical protein
MRNSNLCIRSTDNGLVASPAKLVKQVTFSDWIAPALLLCAIVGLTFLALSERVWMVL